MYKVKKMEGECLNKITNQRERISARGNISGYLFCDMIYNKNCIFSVISCYYFSENVG